MGPILKKMFFKTEEEPIDEDLVENFFDFKIKDLDGKMVHFEKFQGNVRAYIIVNISWRWGLTSLNYKQLTDLYTEYHKRGLEILAFPCNQFFASK